VETCNHSKRLTVLSSLVELGGATIVSVTESLTFQTITVRVAIGTGKERKEKELILRELDMIENVELSILKLLGID
jgi:hypothetical protein